MQSVGAREAHITLCVDYMAKERTALRNRSEYMPGMLHGLHLLDQIEEDKVMAYSIHNRKRYDFAADLKRGEITPFSIYGDTNAR